MSDDLAASFSVLDVDRAASAAEIKAAYLDLVKVWHPDRYLTESPRLRKKVEEKLKQLNSAYERIRTQAPVFLEAKGDGGDWQEASSPDLQPAHFGRSWGYVNSENRLVIPPRFQDARPFSEGLALVRENGRFGFIDGEGEYAIYPEFCAARGFREGRAAVMLTTRWGFINRANLFDVHPLYDECGDFSEGLAAICWRGRWGYIGPTGAFVIRPRYEGARSFQDGWGEVLVGDRWCRINRSGEVFFEETVGELG